jgi:hypothetical protein
MKTLAVLLLASISCLAQTWKPLLNGKNLDGWQTVGDGKWTVLAGGTLIGQPVLG